MNIELKRVDIENFKGVRKQSIDFSKRTTISGRNAVGKTTILDAVLWAIFGKNSQYIEKFDLRPLDANGNLINYVDIVVAVTLDIDGKEVELKKTQKQNWVKKHGTENPVFQGNVNSYEIDGYPKSDKEYKEFINNIISEDLFKILTNPTFFPNMKWKDQREILIKFATNETDVELANKFTGYDELIAELEKATCIEDISKKYAKSKKELDATLKELPIRIDELSKQKVDYDLAELELQKNVLSEKLKGNDDTKIEEIKKAYMDSQFAISKYSAEFESASKNEESDFIRKLNQIKFDKTSVENNVTSLKTLLETEKTIDEQLHKRSSELGTEYKHYESTQFDESEWVFDDSSTKCKYCGQTLPADKIKEINYEFMKRKMDAINSFNVGKETRLKALVDEGWQIKAKRESISKEMADTNAKLEIFTNELNAITDKLSKFEKERPEKKNIDTDSTYIALVDASKELERKYNELRLCEMDKVSANSNIACELEVINGKISQMLNNEKIDERISELTAEQRETAQKIANCEKMLYLVDTFTKQKLDYVSESVNSKFKIVNFKLFDEQINGGISETCECTVNGVPYSDLNAGHKIVAGMDIANTLSNIFEKNVFMFIDNAESVNEFNLPDVENQLIRLVVTDDKELVIS